MIPFQLKGSTYMLPVLKIYALDWPLFTEYLKKTLVMSPSFFINAPLIIDVCDIENIVEIDLAQLVKILRDHQLLPIALRCQSQKMQELAREYYLATFQPLSSSSQDSDAKISHSQRSDNELSPAEILTPESKTQIIEHPVRSGQKIYAQGGDLIILAPVSAGAEILADGNIHVYGPLRGRVYAGFSGNANARIFCQVLEAEFISISGRYLICEHLDYSRVQTTTQIYLENDQLKIAALLG